MSSSGRGGHCHVCCGCLWVFFWFEKGRFRPCLCLLVGGGELHTFFRVLGWGAHFRPEPFAHLRKPRVFGPLSYSGSGVDRKPLAFEDANNGVGRIPLASEDANNGVDRIPLACEDANNGVDRIPLAC